VEGSDWEEAVTWDWAAAELGWGWAVAASLGQAETAGWGWAVEQAKEVGLAAETVEAMGRLNNPRR